MPSPDAVLGSLATIASEWRDTAIYWHLYFAALVLALILRWLSTRTASRLLSLPLASVALVAAASGNPFNAIAFAALTVVLLGSSFLMPARRVHYGSPALVVPGVLLLAAGWSYPHFLPDRWSTYAYAAPLGILPCPTLLAVIGVAGMFRVFAAAVWAGALSIAGTFYGAVGAFHLGVGFDVVLLVGALLPPWAWATAVTGRSVRAGAVERTRSLPGDELIATPLGTLTHAITIRATRSEVWPWLAQMGAGTRAGWYSYDALDNGRHASAARIVPELQPLSVGMIFPALPGATDGFTLLGFERDRVLLLAWTRAGGEAVVTWAFVLEDAGGASTRLITRARASAAYRFHGLPWPLARHLVRLVHFTMQRRQLIGIAARAERARAAADRARVPGRRRGGPARSPGASSDRVMSTRHRCRVFDGTCP